MEQQTHFKNEINPLPFPSLGVSRGDYNLEHGIGIIILHFLRAEYEPECSLSGQITFCNGRLSWHFELVVIALSC
jgi:hypothetical protein